MSTELSASEQFAQDYQIVTDNNFTAYKSMQNLLSQQGSHNISWLSETLRERFENAIGEVIERERRRGNEYTADLISQLLIGYGSTAFDKIARAYIDADLEQRLYEHLSNTLKAGE
jgi:hypothetical protein